MPFRPFPPIALGALVAVLLAVPPAAADDTHRNGFAGRDTFWVKGDSNVKWEELAHRISDEHCKNAPTSEYVKIEASSPPGSVEAEYVHYYYETPPAPVTDRLSAGVWVKAYRPGVQVKARVVFPKERDPNNPDAPLTTLIFGDSYRNVRQWQPLTLGNVPEALRKHLPVLHARLKRAVDPTDAYIDRVVLNVFTGPGTTEVWIDDLEVGPVRADLAPPKPVAGTLTNLTGRADLPVVPRGKAVEYADGQILVQAPDGEMRPFFMLAVRHSDVPLKTLRDAQFNTVWFPGEANPADTEEAARQGFWVVPSVPLPPGGWDGVGKAPKPDPEAAERDANAVARYLRQFLSGDAVLMWDLGGGRTAEDVTRVAKTAEVIRTYDPRRPRAVDLWDGFRAYSGYADAIGTHRWPLFTSLELAAYKEWLAQRKALTPPGKLSWTWVQTHLPDWYVQLTCGRPDVAQFDHPVGPHPEQIRILTYLALAAGNRGLGYWSDKYLSNSHHGRDRLLELALLNTEIEMLKPVLFSAQEPARWVPTSDWNVQAAVIRGPKEVVVLPVWLGGGTQFCPPQGALPSLTVRVPLVPEGAIPWLVSPAGVTELKGVRRVAGGTEITIPEFDLTAAVVFTNDLKVDGKIVQWQDHTRYRVGDKAADWALQQAVEQYNKTLVTHERICQAGGPPIPEAADLFTRSKKAIDQAKEFIDMRQWDTAYREARRALRPLRVLMREHWRLATHSLDVPTASPYAVSFYSLPQHWALAKEVAASRPLGTALPYGQFDLSRKAPAEGAAVTSLPGYKVRQSTLDPVVPLAAIINSDKLDDERKERPYTRPTRYGADRVGYQPDPYDLVPHPNLGSHVLCLKVEPKPTDAGGKPAGMPGALERTFLAVDTAPAELPPGQLVRVSFWAKVMFTHATADGVVVYDTAGGEPLGVRIGGTGGAWKKFHLYRRVPASGKIAVTFALTGLGLAYFDDVQVEPMVSGGASEPAAALPVARGQKPR